MSQTTIDGGEDDRTGWTTDSSASFKFSLDPEARAVRAVTGLLAVFLVLALSGLVAIWLGEEYSGLAGWALAASAVVYIVLVIAACAAPRPSDGDGLLLDSNGLTLIRAGHRRHWSWIELGSFTIATRFRLTGWLLGRRISIGIPDMLRSRTTGDAASPEPTALRIIGDHLSTDGEIVNALSAFRNRAAGHSTPAKAPSRIPGGTFHLRDQHVRAIKTRTAAISGIVSWVSFYAAASAVGGLYDGWQAFLDHWTDPLSHPILLTVATLFVPYDIWSRVRKSAPAGNHLQVDPDGLGLAIEGRRRRWLWDSISAPEIKDLSEPDGTTRRSIVFIARHDGFSSGPQATPGLLPAALRFIIEDIYDAPLESIFGQMAERHANFRSDPLAAAATLPGAMPLPT